MRLARLLTRWGLFLNLTQGRPMIALAALMLVALPLPSFAQEPLAGSDSQYTVVTILHTNDLHGTVVPAAKPGGLAHIGTLVRQIRAAMPNVILVDAGDITHGNLTDYTTQGSGTIAAMNEIGYHAAAAGNHDFDFGQRVLQDVAAKAHFPFLAANIRTSSGSEWSALKDFIILETSGVKVAVFGLATPQTTQLQWPSTLDGLVLADPYEAARSLVPELRSQADVVVALSHLGLPGDERLAREVDGIDFVIGGHSHTSIDDWRWVGSTLVAQAGAYGEKLGRVDFIVRKWGNGSEIASVNGRHSLWNELSAPPLGLEYPVKPLLDVPAAVEADAAVLRAYAPYEEQSARELAVVAGESVAALPGAGGRLAESEAGNLVADAVRDLAAADVAVIDPGSISGVGLQQGKVTVGALYGLIEGYTRQSIVVVRMSGSDLLAGLEKRLSAKKGLRGLISGASLSYSKVGETVRVRDVEIAGAPLRMLGSYLVAGQAYVISEMMSVAPETQVVSEPGSDAREALVAYVRKLGRIRSPGLRRMSLIAQENASRSW